MRSLDTFRAVTLALLCAGCAGDVASVDGGAPTDGRTSASDAPVGGGGPDAKTGGPDAKVAADAKPGAADAKPGAPDAKPADAPPMTPDASPGAPDAKAGSPDAKPPTPDAPLGVPDAPPGVPDAPPAPPDAPTANPPDAGTVTTGGLFETAEPWTKDVSSLSPASDSGDIIDALRTAGGWGGPGGAFRGDDSIILLGGDASTPKRAFTAKDDAWSLANFGDTDESVFYDPDCDRVTMPVPAEGAIEGEDGLACTGDGDCHLLVVMANEKKLYEMWKADVQSDTTFLGGCVAVWDLTQAYGDTGRGKGCSSADAGGFPIAGMLATADEAFAGEIPHALRFILPNGRIRKGIYVPPGTHSTFPTNGGPNTPPYGVRFRLLDSFDETKLPSQGAQVIARALKKYGMFLADGGNIPYTIANDRFSVHKWSETGFSVTDLDGLTVDDFEVVDEGTPIDYFADTNCYRNP